jgi:hypothetical protein
MSVWADEHKSRLAVVLLRGRPAATGGKLKRTIHLNFAKQSFDKLRTSLHSRGANATKIA